MSADRTRVTTATAVAAGVAGAGAQVVLLRELLVVCGGNELAAGVALACWMVSTAVGSGVGGVLLRRGHGAGPLGAVALAAALALAASMWGTELARTWLGPGTGELVPLARALLICGVVLAAPCALLGALFPMLVRQMEVAGRAQPAARVFGLEALGFGVAGLLFGVGLLVVVPAPLAMAGIVGVLALAVPGVWSGPRRGPWIAAATLVFGLGVALLVPRVGRSSLFGERPDVLTDSAHARIEVVAVGEQRNVYLDGLWAFAAPDRENAERAVHPPLLIHPAPRRVLLVGGALSGALDEVLRHPAVEHVDAVEIDPELVRVAQQDLPDTRALDDPRVTLQLTDGRAFVRAADGPYDAIVLVLPDPRNAQLNRFYTVEFFARAQQLLAPGGLLATGIRGSSDMLGPTQARFVASLHTTLAEVFPHVAALPGGRIVFVASDAELVVDPDQMAARLAERGIQPGYVTPFDLQFEMGPLRTDYLQQVLADAAVDPPNRDLVPLCFHQGNLLWATGQAPWLRDLLLRVEGLRPAWLLWAIGIGALLHALLARVGPLQRLAGAAAVRAAVAAAGGTGIAVEVAVILGYQVAYGHLAARIGLIVAAYMLGLAGGAALSGRLGQPRRALLGLQLALVAGCGVLAGLALLPGATNLPGWCELLFVGVTAVAGVLAGAHFPQAVALSGGDRGAGGLYAWDLIGAAGASLVVSVLLLPVFGVAVVLGLAAAANLAAAAVVAAARTPG
jgi:spermidine synthase